MASRAVVGHRRAVTAGFGAHFAGNYRFSWADDFADYRGAELPAWRFGSTSGLGTGAVSFAFRDILQNFLAGILLILSEPFRMSDQIIVGNFDGTVEDIQACQSYSHLQRAAHRDTEQDSLLQ